jgi:Carboxypeptidase regulatory-like domain/TonB dependent receptor-like, beta-barrel/TonB-dependent Receptor Plug Domain
MFKKFGLAIVLCVATGGSLFAQATASISGRIIDQGNAVLPGVTVTVTNTATGATRDTVTNEEGLYSIPALNPGTYSVKAELAGFAPQVRDGVEVLTGANMAVELKLGVAAVAENITVSGQAPLVESTQAVVSSSIRQSEVAQLPMINRSMTALITMLPGAREVPATVSAKGQSLGWVSVGGGGGQNVVMVVDGVDNKEDHCGGTSLSYSLEGVQEFQVFKTGAQAEYGRGTAAVLVATKSGTNNYSGSVFGYFRNKDTVANDYFSKPENGGVGEPPFLRTQYGGSFGGPIKRSHAWFFGSMEYSRQDIERPRSQKIIQELNLLEPLNIGVKVTPTLPQPARDLLSQAKVNFNVGTQHNVFVRYGGELGYLDNSFGGNGSALLDYADRLERNHQKLNNVSSGWSWILNPRMVNQFTVQYLTWTHNNEYPDCPLAQGCLIQRLVFPTVNTGPVSGGGFPNWYNFEDKVQFRNDTSIQSGKHGLKFGVDYAYLPKNGGIYGPGSPGSISFFDDPSVILSNSNGRYPQGLQTPGAVRSISITGTPIGNYDSYNNWTFAGYVQDDFKIASKLTLNLGLRYDVYNLMNQGNDAFAANRTYQVLKAIGSPYGQLPQTDTNNWGPRAGFAYDVRGDGQRVVRGSFGRYYILGIKNSYYLAAIQDKPTLFLTQTQANSAVGVGSLANYVYGVTPLPPVPTNITDFPKGGNNVGAWYDPNLQDFQTDQFAIGYSHVLTQNTVVSFDYSRYNGTNGWRTIDINPLLPNPANPAGARVRPLSADTARVYGDPALLGPVNMIASLNDGWYDEVVAHFEKRFTSTTAIRTDYVWANARGMGGVTDGSARRAAPFPQTPSATGGDINAPWESGPTDFDERHRVTVSGVLPAPWGIEVSPTFVAASARPYTQYRATNPSGQGSLQLLCSSGNSADLGFGAGQEPCGVNNARGRPLVNLNARITKNISLSQTQKVGVFVELYNITNRPPFGNQLGTNQFAPATYNQPIGYLGGAGAVATLPNSFQAQFGARFSF